MWVKVRMWPTITFVLPTRESTKPQPINEDLFFDVDGDPDDVLAEAKARKCGLIAVLQYSDE